MGGLLFVLLAAWLLIPRTAPTAGPAAAPGGVEVIGRLLFTDYLFPFELTSVVLLAAMVGVLLLARRRT
jgi:NADH-quinone oxidoreductase subunit J